MNPIERVEAVLAGRRPDRPPVSFWYHFPPDQIGGSRAVRAHLDVLEHFSLDFLKVMNDNPYPHAGRIERVEDLASLAPLKGDEAGFGAQLQLLADLQAAIKGRVFMPTTIFNAWMVLRLLVEPPDVLTPPNLDAGVDGPSRWIREAYRARPDHVGTALRTIAANLGRFAARCTQAGADGIFLSVRDDWVDTPDLRQDGLYDRLVRPTDLAILNAVADARFNIVHACGKPVNFQAFAAYPAAMIHWADRAAGPSIQDVKEWVKPAICGGVNNLGTLVSGTPEDVRSEVIDALAQAGNRPIMIAPGCTFDPQRVPEANLRAMVDAAQQQRL